MTRCTDRSAVSQKQNMPFPVTPATDDREVEAPCSDAQTYEVRQYASSKQLEKKQLSNCRSALTISRDDGLNGVNENKSEDPNHLSEMQEKLHQIQSNKLMLESKIKEYEEKLKKISQEPQTKEIWARVQKSQKQSAGRSTENDGSENVLVDADGSTLTLGEQTKHSNRQTPRHIFNT